MIGIICRWCITFTLFSSHAVYPPPACSQSASPTLSTEDSIRIFTDSVLSLVEQHSLYVDQLDWETYRAEFTAKVLQEPRLVDALPHFVALWDTLNDHHSGIEHADEWYSLPSRLDTNAMNENVRQAFRARKEPLIQTELLLHRYGYVSIPSISTVDDSLATLQAATALQDSLCRLVRRGATGWIIDLRRNLGGNMYAMLAGVHQLVEKDTFSYWLNSYDSLLGSWSVRDDAIYEDQRKQIRLPQHCSLPTDTPAVAVLVGPLTASSGEITALAFLDQKNAVLIGEPSAGYMTGNEVYRLPFGGYMALAEVYETDRLGKKLTRIKPSVRVKDGDNFDNLLDDTKVRAAIEWLDVHATP